MTVHPIIEMLSPEIRPDAERALRTFLDWQSESLMRRRIVDTYLTGWCTPDFALQTLIGLGLIEHTPGVADD